MAKFDLGEGLKKILLAGVGAVATTYDKGQEIVEDLVRKGELTVEQGKVMNEELKRNVKDKVKENVTVVVKEEEADDEKIIAHLAQMTPEERDELLKKAAAKDGDDPAE